jgi:hypothetical protein
MRGLFHVRSCLHVLKVHSTELFDAAMHFQFNRVSLMAFIAPGNYGGFFFLTFNFTISPLNYALGRLGLRENLRSYDAIACFIDESSGEALADSKEELNSLLSDSKISQPIMILIHKNASGYANDSELISEFELEDVIEKRKGRVSIFTLSDSVRWMFGRSAMT